MTDKKSIEELLFHLKMTSRGLFNIHTGLTRKNPALHNEVWKTLREIRSKTS